MTTDTGRVVKISGPVVSATDLPHTRLFDVVRVGTEQLLGEVIKIDGDLVVMQVFEDTTGLQVGEPVEATGEPLYAELGPGLLGGILDGTQRPLENLSTDGNLYIARGADPPRLDRDRRWDFRPAVEVGDRVGPGDLLGSVPEGRAIEHRILVPTGLAGVITAIRPGPATVLDPVVDIDGHPVAMLRRWPLRRARPVANRLPLTVPLITGQRVLDLLFPVARGGSAIIPGGFGTGKTVLEQSLAKFSTADIVVYVGCGERGNELTEVLEEFPELTDPRTGAPLMERTVLIANTSNMPVAAREASIYTGITIAEYYRDQGYDVAMMADSTSRWGEALREVSSRLEEMPAEDGYPAYLATRLAEFYERAGAVQCLGTPRTHRVGDDRRRRLAGRRRLLRAHHPEQPAARRVLLGARHRAGPAASLPCRELAAQLLAVRPRRMVRPGDRRRLVARCAAGRQQPCKTKAPCRRSCRCSASKRWPPSNGSPCASGKPCARTCSSSPRSTTSTRPVHHNGCWPCCASSTRPAPR